MDPSGSHSSTHLNISFLSMNASWSHSSLVLPMLEQCCRDVKTWKWSVVESTAHEAPERALARLIEQRPDVILSTCYLFTVDAVLAVLARFGKLQPEVPIVLGGPEFLGPNRDFLEKNPFVRAVVRGEGEAVIYPLLDAVGRRDCDRLMRLQGVCLRMRDGTLVDDGRCAEEMPMTALPDPMLSPLFDWGKGFVQLETSRGCQSRCSFCTSAVATGGRMLEVQDVRKTLERVRASGVKAVRVLDRTFNYPKARAMQLMRLFLQEFDDLHFHLEVYPNLVTDEMLGLMEQAKAGQLHIEIGIQTTQPKALKAIHRSLFTERSFEVMTRLCLMPQVPVHADLIVGIPEQRHEDVMHDLRLLSKVQPEEVQMEVLKILPGTPIVSDLHRFDLRHASAPPYEVLASATLAFEEIRHCMRLSRLLDHFYNHCELHAIVGKYWRKVPDFWMELESFLRGTVDIEAPMNLATRYQLLHAFLADRDRELCEELALEWIRKGHSPQKGLHQAELWKQEIPESANQKTVGRDLSPDGSWARDSKLYHLEFSGREYWIRIYKRSQNELLVLGEWERKDIKLDSNCVQE